MHPRTPTNQANTEAVPALLDHIARYRLTTFATLSKLRLLSSDRPRDLRRTLRGLEHQELIASAPLHAGLRYWHLGPCGAARMGRSETASGPLSEPAKLRAYALLRFCCLSNQRRHRLTTEELASRFPDLYRSGLPQGYYFNPAGTGRLGYARVDVGHHGRWDRVVQTVRQDIADHLQQAGFRRLLQAARFEFTVLTVLSQKARRLSDALQALPDSQRVPLQVLALPELLPLVGSIT